MDHTESNYNNNIKIDSYTFANGEETNRKHSADRQNICIQVHQRAEYGLGEDTNNRFTQYDGMITALWQLI